MKPDFFRAVTYNIHRGYGTDGLYGPERIRQLLCEMDADVVGLQEVDTNHQLDLLKTYASCQSVEGLIHERRSGKFGNALLTRHSIVEVRRIDLSIRGSREKRGALDVDIDMEGRRVRVIVTHLGLQIWERHFQMKRLVHALENDAKDRVQQIVMMGDFNLLVSFWPKLRRFYRRLGHTPLVNTFPSFLPLIPLDRIWTQPHRSLVHLEPYRTPLSRIASDHLPLIATIRFKD